MKWSYLSLEGYCYYPSDIYENVPCNEEESGKISILCLKSGDHGDKWLAKEQEWIRECVKGIDKIQSSEEACSEYPEEISSKL